MPPTLAKRYIYKLFANIASIPVYLLMEAILPRALGPGAYGNYNFTTNLFQQLSGFLDMGTSTCFYNALSRRCREISLFAFYIRIIILVALLIFIVAVILLWEPIGSWIIPDVPLWLAPFAALWAFLTWCGRVFRSTNDALGVTIPSEIWRTALSILGIAFLVILYITDYLNIKTLFIQQYFLLGCSALAYLHVCKKYWQNEGIHLTITLNKHISAQYKREFFDYSHPLFVQSLLSFVMLTTERWLLQWFDGSTQQGFYALSQKVSMACFLFVSAMTPLLMREFSIAWGKKDLIGMGALLTRFAPILYGVAAYFSCFTLVEGQTLVELFGGVAFAEAILPVQIMSLYPLHQAYGQIASSVFHASGKTNIPRNLTAAECVYGLIAAWILLAPAQYGGFNLGATGLAIKTVGVQFISVNIYLWLASRFVPFKFWRNLIHQFICVFVMLMVAKCCCSLTYILGLPQAMYIFRFAISGLLYTSAVAVLCLLFPSLLGLSRKEIEEVIIRIKHKQ